MPPTQRPLGQYGTLTPAADVWPRIAVAGTDAWREKLVRHYWSYLTELHDDVVLLHDGDITADGLVVGPQILVVTGDVRLSGRLEDCHAADETLLVVLGDLQTELVTTFWAIFVAGDVRIHGVLYGASSGDAEFCVAGGLSTRAVVDDGHHVEVHGDLDVEVITGHGNGITAAAAPRQRLEPHDALVEGAYEAHERNHGIVTDSSVDSEGLRRLLWAGRPVLADTNVSPADKVIAAVRNRKAKGKKATRLSLESVRLATVPEQLFDLDWLETLILDDTKIAAVPPEIGRLRALRRLDLEGLPITTLPDELCRLPKLRMLSLRYCDQLTELPEAFAELSELEVLYLDGAVLAGGFPAVLTRLPRLKKLWWGRVDDGKLPAGTTTALVDAVRRLPALTQIGFFESSLTTLPADLSPLAALRRVWIGDGYAGANIPNRDVRRLHKALPPGRLRTGYPAVG